MNYFRQGRETNNLLSDYLFRNIKEPNKLRSTKGRHSNLRVR